MTYLHYHFTDETLKMLIARANRKARMIEAKVEALRGNMLYMRRQAQIDRARRELRVLHMRFDDAQAASDKYQEDLDWREDPDALIKLYEKAGYKLVYLCGHTECATEDEALSYAHSMHLLNDLMRQEGPDGSWIDDMLDPEDMVQAAFVMIEKGEYTWTSRSTTSYKSQTRNTTGSLRCLSWTR